jgi:hypothetical protein
MRSEVLDWEPSKIRQPADRRFPRRFNESSDSLGFGDYRGGACRASFFLNERIAVGGVDNHRPGMS